MMIKTDPPGNKCPNPYLKNAKGRSNCWFRIGMLMNSYRSNICYRMTSVSIVPEELPPLSPFYFPYCSTAADRKAMTEANWSNCIHSRTRTILLCTPFSAQGHNILSPYYRSYNCLVARIGWQVGSTFDRWGNIP